MCYLFSRNMHIFWNAFPNDILAVLSTTFSFGMYTVRFVENLP